MVSIPEIFRYWLQGGRVDVGFLGAAQVDRFGNINTTVIGGDYAKPKVRLPGAGGAPEIARTRKEVWIIIKQTPRSFVAKLDFMTSVGHLDGGDSRAKSGARGKGPTAVITDMGVLAPDPTTRELTLVALHPGVTVEQAKAATGWDLEGRNASSRSRRRPPMRSFATLRDLHARTAKAHGTVSTEQQQVHNHTEGGTTMKNIIVATVIAVAVGGCMRIAPIVKVEDVQVVAPNSKPTAAQVRQSIIAAGTSLGWKITDAGPGKLEGTLSLRTHTAVVDIPYSATKYSIVYKSSQNLNESAGTIHTNYNGWVENLDRTIRTELSRL